MILELKNIYKNYIQGSMEVPVLKDINLSVEEGEYVAIMGPSGSGKTTLMNIIGCLDKPTSGSYLLGGEDIGNYKDKELSFVRNKSIGFVFQTFNLMPRQSALDNVALPLQYAKVPKRERKQKCIDALTKVGLEDRIDFKPTQLSGGQKQRVAIARAIVNEPMILLADEPTGNLDPKNSWEIMKLLEQINENGTTVLVVTHNQEIVNEMNERVITMKQGVIVSDEQRGGYIDEN